MIKVYNEKGQCYKFEKKSYPDKTQLLTFENQFYLYNMSIWWKYEDESELATLIYIKKHLDNHYVKNVELKMFYMPNARMDRTHHYYEVFTLKYFCDVINWLKFERVYILDPHSNVSVALLDSVKVLTPNEIIKSAISNTHICKENIVLYFPDESAAKKYADMFPEYEYCYGKKKRDWETGKILDLEIVNEKNIDISENAVLMIDDIISFGGTMYYGAKKLKALGAKMIFAYATHTEDSVLDKKQSKLLEALNDETIYKLFTTYSVFSGFHEKICVLDVNGYVITKEEYCNE